MTIRLWLVACALLACSSANATECSLRETTRIGTYDEDPHTMFGRIADVVVLSDESVVVLDHQIKELRRYSRTGDFLGEIGHQGEGPGEYWDARGVTVLPGDRLVVLSRPSVVSVFDGLTGDFLETFTAPSGLFADHLLEVDDSGSLYVKGVQGQPKPGAEWRFEWLRVDAHGEVLDRLAIPPENPSHEQFVLMTAVGPRWNFAVTTESAWSRRGYFVVGRSERYALEIRRPQGTIDVERDFHPVELTAGERQEWQRRAERMGRNGNKHYTIPTTKPAFRSLQVDSQGRIWVNLYVEATEHTLLDSDGDPYTMWIEPNRYDVFSESGAFLGRVTLPALVKSVAFSRSAIWGVERTDRGEQLIRWEIDGLEGDATSSGNE